MALPFNETFEDGTDYDNAGETESITGSSALSPNASIPGVALGSMGSECLKSDVVGSGDNSYVYWNPTTAITGAMWFGFILEVGANTESTSTLNNIFLLLTSGSATCTAFRVGKDGSDNLSIDYGHFVDGSGVVFETAVNISLNTKYHIEGHFDPSNGDFEWRIDGEVQSSGSPAASARDPELILVGTNSHSGSGTNTNYFDNVYWNTTGYEWDFVKPGSRSLMGMGI